jgi:hypothetical protein
MSRWLAESGSIFLANLLQVDKNTIMTYIGLLEQAYIIFRLSPRSRNLRNEISTSRKIYFYDNGIRNALIANFNPLNSRTDTGELWENFMIGERIKHNHYRQKFVNIYFWHMHNRKEYEISIYSLFPFPVHCLLFIVRAIRLGEPERQHPRTMAANTKMPFTSWITRMAWAEGKALQKN